MLFLAYMTRRYRAKNLWTIRFYIDNHPNADSPGFANLHDLAVQVCSYPDSRTPKQMAVQVQNDARYPYYRTVHLSELHVLQNSYPTGTTSRRC